MDCVRCAISRFCCCYHIAVDFVNFSSSNIIVIKTKKRRHRLCERTRKRGKKIVCDLNNFWWTLSNSIGLHMQPDHPGEKMTFETAYCSGSVRRCWRSRARPHRPLRQIDRHRNGITFFLASNICILIFGGWPDCIIFLLLLLLPRVGGLSLRASVNGCQHPATTSHIPQFWNYHLCDDRCAEKYIYFLSIFRLVQVSVMLFDAHFYRSQRTIGMQ